MAKIEISGPVNATVDNMQRAELRQENLASYPLDAAGAGRNADGTVLDAAGSATDFAVVLGAWGAGGATLAGAAAQNNTKTNTVVLAAPVPIEYVNGQTVQVDIDAYYDAAGGGTAITATVDLECYLIGSDGEPGADLCATAGQAITNAADTYAFEITPSTVLAGSLLQLHVRTAVAEAGDTGTVNSVLGQIVPRFDVKG